MNSRSDLREVLLIALERTGGTQARRPSGCLVVFFDRGGDFGVGGEFRVMIVDFFAKLFHFTHEVDVLNADLLVSSSHLLDHRVLAFVHLLPVESGRDLIQFSHDAVMRFVIIGGNLTEHDGQFVVPDFELTPFLLGFQLLLIEPLVVFSASRNCF